MGVMRGVARLCPLSTPPPPRVDCCHVRHFSTHDNTMAFLGPPTCHVLWLSTK